MSPAAPAGVLGAPARRRRARVVLVMGLGLPGTMWAPVSDRLRDHDVFLPDHAGVGARSGEAPRDTMAGLAADVLRGLDDRGWADAHLVGVSMGGMAAQELAVRWPHRVRSLTLLATTPWGLRLFLRPTGTAIHALVTVRDRAERLQRLLYPAAWRERHRDDVVARTVRMAELFVAPGTARAHLRAVAGHDARNRLRTLRMPVTVVKPALDALIHPSHCDALAACVPHARLVTFPDAGHGLVHQEAEGIARLLEPILAA